MTWQGKRRKQLPSNWASIRKARLEYDGYRCTAVVYEEGAHYPGYVENAARCPARATEVDHHEGPHDHRLSSLRSLCAPHHREKTQREAATARAKKPRRRPTAPHPGLNTP